MKNQDIQHSSPVIAGAVIISVASAYGLYKYWNNGRNSKLPPRASGSWWHNLKKRTTKDARDRFDDALKQSLEIYNQDKERFSHGAVFQFAVPFQRATTIYVADYRLARLLLMGDSSKGVKDAIKKNVFTLFNFVDRNISSIFTAKSEDIEREKARKFMAPAFSNQNLALTIPYLFDAMDWARNILLDHVRSGQSMELKDFLMSLLLKTLSKSSLGIEFSDRSDVPGTIDGKAYLREEHIAIKERFSQAIKAWRRYMFWDKDVKRGDEACKYMTTIGQQVIDTARRSLEQSSEQSHFTGLVIGRLLEHKYPSEKARITDLLVLIIAGHETSAGSLLFFLLELVRHPEIMVRVQQELDRAFGPNDFSDRTVTLQQVSSLPLMNACLKESQRLWPVAAAGSGRTMQEDYHCPELDLFIPKDAVVIFPFYVMNRQAWIDRPNEYIPERWLDGAPQAQQLKEMLMPFSAGKRNCIGQNMATMQLKYLAAFFLRHFSFTLVAEPEVFDNNLTFSPRDLNVTVTAR